MSKRFLITEDERNSILSLYTKKGIIFEQDYTTGDEPKEEKPSEYSLGSYEITVKGEDLILTFNDKGKTYRVHDSETVSGNLLNLKFDVINRKFTDGKVISMTMKQWETMDTEGDSNASVLGDILQDLTLTNIPSDCIGFALGLQSGIPSIYYIMPRIVGLDKPGYRHIDTPEVTMHDLFVPGKREYDDTSVIRNLMTYVNTGGRIVRKGGADYDIKWKEFKKQFGISIKAMKGPEGQGLVEKDIAVPIVLKFEITDPFKFDKTELTDKGEQKFDLFVQEVNDVLIKYGEQIYSEYVDFLKANKVKVTTSASIDNDPKGITANSKNPLTRTLQACRKDGGRPREEYNKCLSEERAKAMIQKLNSSLPDLQGVFIPNAIGETDQFDPGKKWPQVKDSDLTAKNRRLEIIFPVFSKKVR